MVFDNQCYLCVRFAKFVSLLARDKITMIGHYSSLGVKIRNEILDEFALDIFWFINNKRAHSGRAALFPLAKSIFMKKSKKISTVRVDKDCYQDWKTVKAVFVRSSSLLTHSKKIDL